MLNAPRIQPLGKSRTELQQSVAADVVANWPGAEQQSRPPLIVLEPLEAFLNARGIGAGAPHRESARRRALERDLRCHTRRCQDRPSAPTAAPPLSPSAHDVLREARLQLALHAAGVRVPRVLAVCDDDRVIGAPFY